MSPQLPPPPCGEVRLGRRPSGVGVAGHRALKSMPATLCISRRDQGQAIRSALTPAADTGLSFPSGRRAPSPAAPLRLGLRPSPPPPQGGRGTRRDARAARTLLPSRGTLGRPDAEHDGGEEGGVEDEAGGDGGEEAGDAEP